jgi:hypothetical protein
MITPRRKRKRRNQLSTIANGARNKFVVDTI